METSKEQSQLKEAIADLKEETAVELVRELLANKTEPLSIVTTCQEGLRLVGLRYEQHSYYLSGLVMGGEIFREVMEMVGPKLRQQITGTGTGKLLIGTVAGDIHDLGKNIVKTLLSCYNMEVIDIGVDISPAEFLRRVQAAKPDIIGMSGLITRAYDSMRETITLLHNEGVDQPIVIGGSLLDQEICAYTGADYWVSNADDGVKLCLKLVS